MPTPRLLKPRTASNRRSTSSAGRLAVGSSSTRKSQLTTSARAIATSDFSVRLRLRTRRLGSIRPPIKASVSSARRSALDQSIGAKVMPQPRREVHPPATTRNHLSERHVFGDRHPLDEAKVLVNKGDALARIGTGPIGLA